MLQYKFHLSSYWNTWSRVLSDNDSHGPFVEVNLTPIHHWEDEVAPIRIRFHGTARDSRDKDTNELPEDVRRRMVDALGEELVERLLTEDFLPQIDYSLYMRFSNGGANLTDILVVA